MSQMFLFAFVVWLIAFAFSAEFRQIVSCNKLKVINPCALRDAGCMCLTAVSHSISPSIIEHCGWQSLCETQQRDVIPSRIKTMHRWFDTWSAVGAIPGACFNHAECTKTASQLVLHNATLIAMHQLGSYLGPEGWCDFVGLTTHYVSKNIFSMLFLSHFSDSDVEFGNDGNTYYITLSTCAVRTFSRPNTIVPLKMEIKFAPSSDMIEKLTITDAMNPNATWMLETGFAAVGKSSVWFETRSFCGGGGGSSNSRTWPCSSCDVANRTILSLLSEIRPNNYCESVKLIPPLYTWEEIPGIRHARVC